MGQLVVFGTGVREDVDEGSWQGDLQGDLNGADAHLWTVAAPLGHTERGENVHLSSLSFFGYKSRVERDHFTRGSVFGHLFSEFSSSGKLAVPCSVPTRTHTYVCNM